jgi:hypothetical protein
MKQYYLFLDNEQTGPLTIEEISTKITSRETKVWFEGLEDWKSAGEIEELSKLLVSIPPPINSFTSKLPTESKVEEKIEDQKPENQNVIDYNKNETKILGLGQKMFFGVYTLAIFIIFFAFNNYQINSLTEKNKQQIDNQQKEIKEQETRLAEQEQIEANRKIQERKDALESSYAELSNEVNILYENLNIAQENLNDVAKFKFLRGASERNEQINSAQNDIDIIMERIRYNETEMQKINEQLGI